MRKSAYPTAYDAFRNAVETLSLAPLEQCRAMGNHNVAWELKDDVSAGSYVLASEHCSLNIEQRRAVEDLIQELTRIPNELLHEATSEAENLKAMSHPKWARIRMKAAKVFQLLPEPEF